MMKEPEINVGIVNAQEIHFSLNGRFLPKEKPYVANKASLSVKEAFCGTAICIVS